MTAIQIRDVSDDIRHTLIGEARRRGQSLQSYLLDVLRHEAEGICNRARVDQWQAEPLTSADIDTPALLAEMHDERERTLLEALRSDRSA